MTKITFLGTGEAFDPMRTTTSYLLENESGKALMVDCGYDAPKSLMRYFAKEGKKLADSPNSLIFTHEHGDHFAGLPALLMPIFEEVNGIVGDRKDGIRRKLEIVSAHDLLLGYGCSFLDRVEEAMERDYKGLFKRFKTEGPDILLRKIDRKKDEIQGFHVSAALTSHSVKNYAYRFKNACEEREFAISGDGALTNESMELFRGVDVLIHEGFNVNGYVGKNHASISDVLSYAIRAEIPRVYIIHVNREERKKTEEIEAMKKKAISWGVELFLPNDHDSIVV